MANDSEVRLARSASERGLNRIDPSSAVSRRAFILGAGAMLAAAPSLAKATAPAAPAVLPVDPDFWKKPRELWLTRQGSGETAKGVFWSQGSYQTEAYVQLCRVLRDVRADSTVQMDVVLLNVLAGIQAFYRAYGWNEPIYINSGFRTVATNQALRPEGSALNSMHLYGKAADITLPGVPVWHLGQVKQYLHAGGVGFYPSRHFVHVDTGASRSWQG